MNDGEHPGCTYCQRRSQHRPHRGRARPRLGCHRWVKFPFVGNGKAIALGEPEGFIKTIFDCQEAASFWAPIMIGAEVTG